MANSQDIIVEKNDVDCRLSTWITRNNRRLNFNSVNILCRKGLVRINGLKAKASYRLVMGDVISIPIHSENIFDTEPTTKIDPKLAKSLQDSIIYKDKYLIALNKPEGLASQGGSNQGARHIDAYKYMLQFGANDAPRLIHRLDKDTSGILLLARDIKTAKTLTSLFKERLVEKIYWALVKGVPQKQEGKLESHISNADIWKPRINKDITRRKERQADKGNTKHALTYYKVVEKIGSQYSWLQLKPASGRTHQLRIHCAELGNPIVGDRKYNKVEDKKPQDLPYISKKLFLHARRITFTHPVSKKTINIEAEVPQHMYSVWRHFGWEV